MSPYLVLSISVLKSSFLIEQPPTRYPSITSIFSSSLMFLLLTLPPYNTSFFVWYTSSKYALTFFIVSLISSLVGITPVPIYQIGS